MAGSGIKGLNINSEAFSDALTVASGGITGGISSTIAGGDFWQGMRHGLITTGLNHIQHKFVNSLNLSSNGESTETVSDCPKCKEFWAKLKSFANDMGQAFYSIDPEGQSFDNHMNYALQNGSGLGEAGVHAFVMTKAENGGLSFIGARSNNSRVNSAAVNRGTKLLSNGRFPNIVKKFSKHSEEWSQWGSISQKTFYNRAVKLADSPIKGNIYGFTSKQGWSFKFNSKTGEFLTTHPKGHIETFFRPNNGMNYYLKQLQLYGK